MSPDPRIARTRARVMAAAWELLTEVGFAEVTVDLVSERSGVSRSTLYRHWSTTEEILRDAFSAAALAGDDVGGSPRAPARRRSAHQAFVQYVVAFADGLVHLWGRAAVTLAVSALDDPEQRAVQRTFIHGNRRDIAALLAQAQEDGHARSEVDLDDLVELTLGPLFYRYLFTDAPADTAAARQLAERVWQWLAP